MTEGYGKCISLVLRRNVGQLQKSSNHELDLLLRSGPTADHGPLNLSRRIFADCNIGDDPRLTLKQAIGDLLSPLGIPVAYGLAFGHIDSMITFPNGIRAALDADKCKLKMLEQAVK